MWIWGKARPEERALLTKAWLKVAPGLKAKPDRWTCSKGPVAATICILTEAGWDPMLPWLWRAPSGELEATLESEPFANIQIAKFFETGLVRETWRRAASKQGGGGLARAAML